MRDLEPNRPGYDSARARCFEHIGQAGKWSTTLDYTFYQGYGYMGYAYFSQGDYRASVAAYTQGIRYGSAPFLFHCRALAYHALGDEANAQRDLTLYLQDHQPGTIPDCQSLFPETRGIFEIP
jgi:hypothetical protein